MPKSFTFPYTISNQSFCQLPGEVLIILCEAFVHGWKTKRIWSDRLRGFTDEYAFFITYNGIEYGSFDFDESVLIGNPCIPDDFFIFDYEFEVTFE